MASNPKLIVIAGPNGAGKSAFICNILLNIPVMNPDIETKLINLEKSKVFK
ncbi:hypothetical protein [Mastigocoleus sp. MO_188.B34]|uniref:hypothetical protein n=1 Tax=Mastigocoleus sp. MO_188.B34 TaxID=3036635 RepID=UPI0026085A99|nr:hypothetical protein [Mastigocoleus sp. MO_188.B34]